MTERNLPARFGRFLLDHLLLWILAAMIVTVVGILFVGPRNMLFDRPDNNLEWPQAQKP
ncbi:hypothetical protein ACQZ4Q_21655 [Agrobacterium vitis]